MNDIDTTGHAPGCPDPVGGDCDCLSEVWCYRCDQSAVRTIRITRGGRAPETVSACSTHLWLLIHPRGLGRRDAGAQA